MEYLDVVDNKNENIIGFEERNKVHELGLFHREMAAWIINENNEILISKRASTKKISPNKWESCAGHVESGEDLIDAVKREVKEELGIDVNDIELIDIRKIEKKFSDNLYNNFFQYTYFVTTDKKIEEYNIELNETSEIKYISLNELKEAVKNKDDNYVFTADNFYDYSSFIINEMEKRSNK